MSSRAPPGPLDPHVSSVEDQLRRRTLLEAAYLLFHLPIGAQWTRLFYGEGKHEEVWRLPPSYVWRGDLATARPGKKAEHVLIFIHKSRPNLIQKINRNTLRKSVLSSIASRKGTKAGLLW